VLVWFGVGMGVGVDYSCDCAAIWQFGRSEGRKRRCFGHVHCACFMLGCLMRSPRPYRSGTKMKRLFNTRSLSGLTQSVYLALHLHRIVDVWCDPWVRIRKALDKLGREVHRERQEDERYDDAS
jgi:hypothetical protein